MFLTQGQVKRQEFTEKILNFKSGEELNAWISEISLAEFNANLESLSGEGYKKTMTRLSRLTGKLDFV
jgi:hypothetical protein